MKIKYLLLPILVVLNVSALERIEAPILPNEIIEVIKKDDLGGVHKFLLEHPENINARSIASNKPMLQYAVESFAFQVIDLLLKNHADAISNNDDHVIFSIFREYLHGKYNKKIEKNELENKIRNILRLFIQSKTIDINKLISKEKCSILFFAIHANLVEVVKFLLNLNKPVDLYAKNIVTNFTALDFIDFLLELSRSYGFDYVEMEKIIKEKDTELKQASDADADVQKEQPDCAEANDSDKKIAAAQSTSCGRCVIL